MQFPEFVALSGTVPHAFGLTDRILSCSANALRPSRKRRQRAGQKNRKSLEGIPSCRQIGYSPVMRPFSHRRMNWLQLSPVMSGSWGLSPAELLPLERSKQDFDAAMAEQAEQSARYRQTVARKQEKREELERTLRRMVRRINNHPGMTEELRKKMGLASPTRTARLSRQGRSHG